jgi:hypothetical protein
MDQDQIGQSSLTSYSIRRFYKSITPAIAFCDNEFEKSSQDVSLGHPQAFSHWYLRSIAFMSKWLLQLGA